MIDWKKFVAIVLALDKNIFLTYMAYFRAKISLHPAQKVLITLLLAKKISVLQKYADFLDVFYKKSITILSNCLIINKHIIALKLNK